MEKVKIILFEITLDYDTVLTLASFLIESLPLQNLIDVLMEFESHQTRAVTVTSFHAHLVEATQTTLVADSVRSGR